MNETEFQTYRLAIHRMVDKKPRQSQPRDLAPIINSLCEDLKGMKEDDLRDVTIYVEKEARYATTQIGRDCASYLFSVCEAECIRRGSF